MAFAPLRFDQDRQRRLFATGGAAWMMPVAVITTSRRFGQSVTIDI
jgi:hypothetical protein